MRVCVLSIGDPWGPRRWSGSSRSIMEVLQNRGYDLRVVSANPLKFIMRIIERMAALLGFDIQLAHSVIMARLGGLYCTLAVRKHSPDVVLVMCSSGLLAFLETTCPTVYLTDGTFEIMSRLYPQYRAYPDWLKRDGNVIEKRALTRATRVVIPTRWAAESVRSDYGVAPEKVVTASFGPNLPKHAIPESAPQAVSDGTIRVLHVSMDWERKGGDLVVETTRRLNASGVSARAVLVGRVPDHIQSSDQVEVAGYLRKNDPAELARLCQIYRTATVFMLPSSADASPIVLSEAQAFALPCLVYDAGGVAEAVPADAGFVLPLGAPAKEFADRICMIARDSGLREMLRSGSRRNFDQRANFQQFVSAFGLDEYAKCDNPEPTARTLGDSALPSYG